MSLASPSPQLSAEELAARLDKSRLPHHVAIIMDGNGRWAEHHGLPRLEGHRAGEHSIRATVQASAEIGLAYLTLYAFSAENWQRPEAEVKALLELIGRSLAANVQELHRDNIHVRMLGRFAGLPTSLQEEMRRAEEMTKQNTGLVLQLAVNYGGRQEIVDAARRLAEDAVSGALSPEQIDEARFAHYLYRPDLPDPDLLIRTGGELRVSNYLLWQIAYSEIHVTPTLWPDFRAPHLYQAVVDYQGRHRRFGGVDNAT
jgi:undecaprenyl diphosphate synthase